MRLPFRKKPKPLDQPAYVPPVRAAVEPEEGIVVDEHDTSTADEETLAALRLAQSQTGFHRAWKRATGKE